jgi:hypothetical protein
MKASLGAPLSIRVRLWVDLKALTQTKNRQQRNQSEQPAQLDSPLHQKKLKKSLELSQLLQKH